MVTRCTTAWQSSALDKQHASGTFAAVRAELNRYPERDRMRYRRLGRTGLNVSEISLGTVEIGLDYGLTTRPSESEVERLLNRALDLGVNFLDTARLYGESEALIGQILHHRCSEFFVCTKVAAASEAEMRESIDTSLKALRRDSVDMLMIHSAPVDVIGQGEAIRVLQELRQEGKVKWVGVSVYGETAAVSAIRTDEFDCIQVACSVLDRRPETAVWAEARTGDVGVVGRSVLLRGALTDRTAQLPDSLADLKRAVREVNAVAQQAGVSLPELAYRYLLGQDLPHTALVGASAVEEVEAAVAFAAKGPLSDDVVRRIRQVTVADERNLNPGTWDAK